MLCDPKIGPTETVATPEQRRTAAKRAVPPLLDIFAWPDGPFGVLASGTRYAFFATDGGRHRNAKAGSVTRTLGTLANPLGNRDTVVDAGIQNDLGLDPLYRTYGYIGGGPVYMIPRGLRGAGSLLTVFHAERNTMANGFYSSLGLARSTDGGRSWHDLGEIVEANRPYRPAGPSFEIGMSQIVIDPTGAYVYVYFPDWLRASGTMPSRLTVMSVARVRIRDLVNAAFAPSPRALPPFRKFYQGRWDQPGIGGVSSDLQSGSIGGSPSVTFDAFLKRYVVIADDTQNVSYAESPDGVRWTPRRIIFSDPNALYARAIGTGGDPNQLDRRFFVYYTKRPNWNAASVIRFVVNC